MKKSIILVIVALLLGLSSFNLLIARISANQLDSALDQVEALASNEEGGSGGGCESGGEGATYCFVSWITTYYDENGNEIYSVPNECEINCMNEYYPNHYACCTHGGCFCRAYEK